MADPKLVIAGGLGEDAKNFSEALKRRKAEVEKKAAMGAEPKPSEAPQKGY